MTILLAAAVVVLLYFWLVAPHVNLALAGSIRDLVLRTEWSKTQSALEIDSVARLAAAGTTQAGLGVGLMFFFGIGIEQAGLADFNPIRLVYGFFLGIGEMAASSLLGHAVVRLMTPSTAHWPEAMDDWLTEFRGGWMRLYLLTFKAAPIPIAFALAALYVAGEEIIFRSVFVTVAMPWGATFAVVLPTLLFMAVQVFRMPSWRAATFPLIGAMVLGIVHAIVFQITHDVTPLIVAHITFFLAAIL